MISPRPLSVGIVCFSTSWGGLEIVLARIARSLKERDHSVLLISPPGSPLEQTARKQSIPHRSLLPRLRYLDMAAAKELVAISREQEIGTFIATRSRDISTVVLTKFFRPGLRCVYFQQMQFGHSKRGIFHRILYRNLDAWITLTEAMRRSVLRNTVVPERRVSVIPFGVMTDEFDPGRFSRAGSRRRFRLPVSKQIVGVLGRFDRQKGQADLLRAAPLILAKSPRVHFVFVGEETRGEEGHLAELKALVKEKDLSSHVSFLPFTSEVPRLLRALDLLVVPSHNETFGYVAVEGMAMGIPVIGTDAGGLPEIIRDGDTGILVPPADVEALAGAVNALLRDPKLCRKMSAAARRRARGVFDFEKNIDQLEGVLGSLA
ncbi:MAG: glycosyltransferase family 4 protein [Ignavibacterium sp.]